MGTNDAASTPAGRGPPDALDADPFDSVVDVLQDDDCRKLLAALDGECTASDLAESCDLPRSTTYRKLGHLSDVGLVAEHYEVRDDGKRTTKYRRAFRKLRIGLDEEGLTLSVERL